MVVEQGVRLDGLHLVLVERKNRLGLAGVGHSSPLAPQEQKELKECEKVNIGGKSNRQFQTWKIKTPIATAAGLMAKISS